MFNVDDRVVFTRDVGENIPAGTEGVIIEVRPSGYPYPYRVALSRGKMPVKTDEIRLAGMTVEQRLAAFSKAAPKPNTFKVGDWVKAKSHSHEGIGQIINVGLTGFYRVNLGEEYCPLFFRSEMTRFTGMTEEMRLRAFIEAGKSVKWVTGTVAVAVQQNSDESSELMFIEIDGFSVNIPNLSVNQRDAIYDTVVNALDDALCF